MSIKIDLKILLFLLLFSLTSQIDLYIVLMLFAFIHEIGHLCAGLLLGFKPQEVAITPVGMRIEFKPKCEEYNQKVRKGNTLAIKRGIIAIAGPLTNFAIIAVMILIGNIKPEFMIWNIHNINYITIIYSNFLIGIFNLIPIYPLDGGRIIKEILHIIVGLERSETYTYKISKITIILLTIIASIAILYMQNISIIIILAYLLGIVLVERKRYYTRQSIRKMVEEEAENITKKLAYKAKTW